MQDKNFPYPVTSFYFRVEIGSLTMRFQEVSGLDMETEMLEYRHGNSKSLITMKRVGLSKTTNLSFKKGIFIYDNDLVAIYNKMAKDKDYFTHGRTLEMIISLLDMWGIEVMTWKVAHAVPLKLSGPTLKSDSNEVAIETMEFAHDGLEVLVPSTDMSGSFSHKV